MNIEGLEFRSPEKLQRVARDANTIIPPAVQWGAQQGHFICKSRHRLPVSSDARNIERRNILIWFLLASRIETRNVSELFELSASRCRSIAARCAKKYCIMSVAASKILTERMSINERDYHQLHDSMEQMLVAENMLEDEIYYPEVRYCLEMGRRRYAVRFAGISGETCNCKLCGNGRLPAIYESYIYWPEIDLKITD